jgi:anaerobic ribonucleoside-triphosphate reductase
MCSVLLEQKREPYESWYAVCTRVGMSVYDAWMIDQEDGFESHDNANLKPNAETSHKKKADKLSKEQNLLTMPPHLALLHQTGELHIHDLEKYGGCYFARCINIVSTIYTLYRSYCYPISDPFIINYQIIIVPYSNLWM